MGEKFPFNPAGKKIVTPGEAERGFEDKVLSILQQQEARLNAVTAFVRRHDEAIFASLSMLEFLQAQLAEKGVLDAESFAKAQIEYLQQQHELRLKMIEESKKRPELFVPKNMAED
jgi:hypothetical protein